MAVRLGVNIDHVATLRQAREGLCPDPIHAAVLCELGGADSIVVHLREDRRHIQDKDVQRLLQMIHIPLNLEMSIDPEIVRIAQTLRPQQATLVPEKRRELTTEGGLDVMSEEKRIGLAIEKLQKRGIRVSLFVDPKRKNIQVCSRLGAQWIELHTGEYASASREKERWKKLRELQEGTESARSLGLRINAGHGLDYWNVGPVAKLAGIEELNIGHAIVARAVLVGMERAVREMKELVNP